MASLTKAEQKVLTSEAGPIVIADSQPNSALAPSVNQDLNTVGVMLPTTALHWLVCNALHLPLVCTSANPTGRPLVYQMDSAIEELKDLADIWLEHDREIEHPVDDSVVRVMAGRLATIRMGRGFAPLSLPLDCKHSVVAYGGHQKSAIAISNGAQCILGPHVGDLDTTTNRDRYDQKLSSLEDLYQTDSEFHVCDLHPEYYSTRKAIEHTEKADEELLQVQHHHAHVVSGMIEHGWLDQQVLGVSFDGNGFSNDETIWGGEFLLTTASECKRVGSFRPFNLVGGEQAIRQPWRCALSVLLECEGEPLARQHFISQGFGEHEVQPLIAALNRPSLIHKTSSVGRLFDAVAALIMNVKLNHYEGEAAMKLESACDTSELKSYEFEVERPDQCYQLDWRPVIQQILSDRRQGVSVGAMAMRFHRGLADAVLKMASLFPEYPVVLSGGVFQNRVLVELIAELLDNENRIVGLPGRIPVNDGGLAAGQLAIAASLVEQNAKP